jgi:GxxExxY protein
MKSRWAKRSLGDSQCTRERLASAMRLTHRPGINTDKECLRLARRKTFRTRRLPNRSLEPHSKFTTSSATAFSTAFTNARFKLSCCGVVSRQSWNSELLSDTRGIVGEYDADLIVAESVVIEVKIAPQYDKRDEAQLLNMLKATGIKVGILVNSVDTKSSTSDSSFESVFHLCRSVTEREWN